MNNKFYGGFVSYIKENFVFLLILVVIAIAFNINTNYSIYKPGGSINITERLSSKDFLYESKGSINMAYVGMIEGKLPFFLLGKIIPSWDVKKNSEITYSDEETMKDMQKRDRLFYEQSISAAKYLAFRESGVKFDIIKENSYVIYVSKECSANLKIGDELLKYDNHSYQDIATLKAYIATKEVGEEINFMVNRDGKNITTSGKVYVEEENKLIGVMAATIYEISAVPNIKIDSKASESGPSGGLMLTLAIYNALVPEDITKGNKIVGTGTINLDGTVGEIGGVTYKLAGAVKEKADIFIVPLENYEDAINYATKKKYDIIIKGVGTFNEALKVLRELEAK